MSPLAQTLTALPSAGGTANADIYAIFGKFATSILVGLLIGLEREWAKATDKALFAGIRTFPFIALLGCLSAMVGSEHMGAWFFGAAYAGFVVFVAANHFVTGAGHGTTTEITSMLVFLFGGLVYWDHQGLAASLAVIVTVILSIKQPLHQLANRVESQDIYATLKFAVVSIIVLPLLPDRSIEIAGYEYLAVLNPRHIWLLVVMVTGIAFLGYVAGKVVGPGRGIALAGLLGGIVSSTAVTISMSERSHEDERLAPQLSLAVILASTMLFARTTVEVAVVHIPLARDLVIPLVGASVFGVAASAYLWFRGARSPVDTVQLKNPFSLLAGVKFALLLATMLVLSKFLVLRYDRFGIFLAAGIGGLVDARPITLSVASLARHGAIDPIDAVAAVMLGALANTLLRFCWALIYGAPVFRRLLMPAFGLVIVGGVIATALVLRFGILWIS